MSSPYDCVFVFSGHIGRVCGEIRPSVPRQGHPFPLQCHFRVGYAADAVGGLAAQWERESDVLNNKNTHGKYLPSGISTHGD